MSVSPAAVRAVALSIAKARGDAGYTTNDLYVAGKAIAAAAALAPLVVIESSITENPDGTIDEMHLLAPAHERPRILKPGDLGPDWDIDYEADGMRFTARCGPGPKETVVANFLAGRSSPTTIHGVTQADYGARFTEADIMEDFSFAGGGTIPAGAIVTSVTDPDGSGTVLEWGMEVAPGDIRAITEEMALRGPKGLGKPLPLYTRSLTRTRWNPYQA